MRGGRHAIHRKQFGGRPADAVIAVRDDDGGQVDTGLFADLYERFVSLLHAEVQRHGTITASALRRIGSMSKNSRRSSMLKIWKIDRS